LGVSALPAELERAPHADRGGLHRVGQGAGRGDDGPFRHHRTCGVNADASPQAHAATTGPPSIGRSLSEATRSLIDVLLTVLVVLMLPIVLVLGAPLTLLAWLVVVTAQRVRADE